MSTLTCIIPDCNRKRVSRGLCLACFHAARRMIKSGKVTEEFLEDNDLMLRSHSSRRGQTGVFYLALSGTKGWHPETSEK